LHAKTLPGEMHDLALSSVKNAFSEKFKNAENDAKSIIKKYPDHPAGYFFYAAVLNYHMEYLQSEKYEDEFYKYCDLAISKGEKLAEKQPGNAWPKFFIAGANGLKGKYEARYEKLVTAFKHGWRGVVIFREILKDNKELYDVLYGIGTYDYWRSTKTKLLWWLPGIQDKREVSIKILYELKTKGLYVKESASLELLEILNNEKRYAEVVKVANEFLKAYPSNMKCHWEKAKALIGLEEYKNAEKSFNYIMNRLKSESFENNYNVVLCNCYLIEIYFAQKKYDRCLIELDVIKSLELSSISQKRLGKHLDKVFAIERKVRRKKESNK
jgi:hypothetical protein